MEETPNNRFVGFGPNMEGMKDDNPSFEFLASPYYSPQQAVRERRYGNTKAAMAALISQGRRVFSPIVMCHPLACEYDMGLRAVDWAIFNRPFIKQAENIIVLRLAGWKQSNGVAAEIELARKFKKSIEYVDPETLGIK